MTSVNAGPSVPLLWTGGAVAAAGVTAGTVGTVSRLRLEGNKERVVARTAELVDAKRGQQVAEDALVADRVHPPAGTSAREATAWLQQRFTGNDVRALTQESDHRSISISTWGSPTRIAGEALETARDIGDGRAAGVIRAGEWHVPVRLSDSLTPLEKSRRVSYQEVEYRWEQRRNPATGQNESVRVPVTVTKYRTEHYLDHFNRYRGAHDGVDALLDGQGRSLRKALTIPELTVSYAQEATSDAANALRKAEKAVKFSGGGAKVVQAAGIATAVVGASVLGAAVLGRDK